MRGRAGGRVIGRSGGRNGGRSGRGCTKHSGIFDAYCMEVAPLYILENQIILTG